MDEQKRRYLLIKLATEKFKLNPEYLSDEQRIEVEKQAEKLHALQNSIMATSEAQSVRVTTSQLMKAYQKCVEQFESEEAFYLTLKKQGLTTEGFKTALKDELYCEKILEYISKDTPELDKKKAIEYYNSHRLNFSRAKTWKLSQILITVNNEFAENTRENALARIREAQKRCQSEPFDKLALEYSECPSAVEHGSLGWCEDGKLYPELSSVLYKLGKDEISEPIETEVGFHLIVWHEEKPPYVAPFEEVWPFLKEKHSARAKAYLQRQWISQLSY